MLRALAVVVVMMAGCGPQQECTASSPSASICDVDQFPGAKPGTGNRLIVCQDGGRTTFIQCANGCTARGSADICN